LEHLERLQNLERLQCLESLDRLDRLDRLDYRQVSLPDDAVVYCDIPYKSANTYLSSFDYEAFYDWARNQEQDVFISEYDMPDDFYLVTEFGRTSLLSPDSRDTVKERLYCNHKYEIDEQLTLF
jgi:DNA adenine methylase